MNPVIIIFGANGFLGRYLCRHFARNGKEVVAIGRSRKGWSGDGMFLEWDGKNLGPWALALEGAEAVAERVNWHRVLVAWLAGRGGDDLRRG